MTSIRFVFTKAIQFIACNATRRRGTILAPKGTSREVGALGPHQRLGETMAKTRFTPRTPYPSNNLPAVKNDDSTYITVDEAFAHLKNKVSRTSLYRAINSGQIPALRVGRRVLLRKETLDAIGSTTSK